MLLHFAKDVIGGRSVLVANDVEAAEWMSKRKPGQIVAMDPVQVRNAKRSALYRVICRIVADNHPDLTDGEAVSDAIKLLTGCFNVVAFDTPGGRIFWRKPKSLSFANMKEDDFEAYFDRAMQAISEVLLPGCDIDAMRKDAYLASGYIRGETDSQGFQDSQSP